MIWASSCSEVYWFFLEDQELMVHSICVWALTLAAFSAGHWALMSEEVLVLSLYYPNSFASPLPQGSISFFNLFIHSLNTCLLSIYWEMGLPLGVEDTVVNKRDQSPCLTGPFFSLLFPPPSVKMGESQYASSTLQISKCTAGHRP